MSAAMRIGGRICPECHEPLEGVNAGTVRHPLCQLVHRRALRKAIRIQRRIDGIPEKHAPKPEFKSVAPRMNCVKRDTLLDPERKPNVLCKVCFGMPWARGEDRHDGHYNENGAMSLDGSVRCRGCGESWAAEPPPEPVSVLGSSAGTAARYGRLYGDNPGSVSRAKYRGE